ncbi:MAG: alpha/beta hydrolase [Acidimicrobiales bacterium]
MVPETVSLVTIDGLELAADVVWAEGDARGFVVIGHPHPAYGGDRWNNVVRSLQEAAAACGCHSIAPDFRGAGQSAGEHDGGGAERLDLAAACDFVGLVEESLPVVMSGYSFGAAVGLNVSYPSVTGWLAVAPPVSMLEPAPVAAHDHRPKHILLPRHDQFSTVDAMQACTRTWNNTSLTVIEGVDHFIATGAFEPCCAALETLLA